MASTYLGTASTAVNSNSATTLDVTHTVAANTTILLIQVSNRNGIGGNTISIEDWAVGEPFVFIGKTVQVDAGDAQFEIWGVINPTVKTNTITCTWSSSTGNTYQYAAMVNHGGTSIVSVAAATNVLENVDNTTPAATTVFASDGPESNGLVVFGASIGDDSSPASIDASFTEVVDANTGGGSGGGADSAFYVAYLLDGAPAAPTITWGATDDNAGIMLELVAAGARLVSSAGAANQGDAITLSNFTIGNQARRWMNIHISGKFAGGAGGSVTSITVGGTDFVSNTIINAPTAQDEFRQMHSFFVNEADFATLGVGDHDIVATYNPNNSMDHLGIVVQYFADIDQTLGAVGALQSTVTVSEDGPWALSPVPDSGGGNNLLIGATMQSQDQDIDWSGTDGTEVEDEEVQDAGPNAATGCMHSPGSGTSALKAEWDIAANGRNAFTAFIIHEDLGGGGAPAARPQGPFGHPLHGPFSGPL